MKLANPEVMELTADVFKACRKYEKIIGDDVHFYVSTDENAAFSWVVTFVKMVDSKPHPDKELIDWIFKTSRNQETSPVENLDKKWRGSWPSILCKVVGDCEKGFKFLLANYPPWQNHAQRPKLQRRTAKRIGQSLPKAPSVEAL